jgi:excisionase family DNA binding protein
MSQSKPDAAADVRFVTTASAANYLGLSVSMLNKLRLTGEGPEFHKFGKSVRYRRDQLDDWAVKCRRKSTSDEGASHGPL